MFFYGIAGEYLTQRLRLSMFEKLLEQEIGFYDDKDNATGALCARLSGEAAAVQGVSDYLSFLYLKSVWETKKAKWYNPTLEI